MIKISFQNSSEFFEMQLFGVETNNFGIGEDHKRNQSRHYVTCTVHCTNYNRRNVIQKYGLSKSQSVLICKVTCTCCVYFRNNNYNFDNVNVSVKDIHLLRTSRNTSLHRNNDHWLFSNSSIKNIRAIISLLFLHCLINYEQYYYLTVD